MSRIQINKQFVDVTLRPSGLGHGHEIAIIVSPLDPTDEWVLEVRPVRPGYVAAVRHPLEGTTDLGYVRTLDEVRTQAARVVLGYAPVMV